MVEIVGTRMRNFDWMEGKNMDFCKVFSSNVEQNPNDIAVVYGNKFLTYQQLETRSSALAKNLIFKGVKRGDVIGLLFYNSLDLIVGFLGILKSGGVYLPLDPNYPINRIRHIILDSQAKFLVLEEGIENVFSDFNGSVYYLNDELLNEQPTQLPAVSPEQVAYIIYTSGSTGMPKGIVVTRASLSHAATAFSEIQPKKPTSLLTGSISFDPSILIIIHALFLGGTIYLSNNRGAVDIKNFNEIVNAIEENSIDFILSTPSFYGNLLDNAAKLPTLRNVYLCGEIIVGSLVDKHISVAQNANLYNTYGPSEYAIGSTVAIIYDCIKNLKGRITIGKCFSSNKIYVLDDKLKSVPIGVKGEIFVGGPGLSKGYLNNQLLTQEKFIYCSDLEKQPIKLFKTGDLGYQLSNADIVFTGRKDFQVKIYGHRVELEEIECQVLGFRGIDKAIAAVREKRIIVFYSSRQLQFELHELEEYLKRELPSYMVPSSFIEVKKWPITKNGKIDRKKLEQQFDRGYSEYAMKF